VSSRSPRSVGRPLSALWVIADSDGPQPSPNGPLPEPESYSRASLGPKPACPGSRPAAPTACPCRRPGWRRTSPRCHRWRRRLWAAGSRRPARRRDPTDLPAQDDQALEDRRGTSRPPGPHPRAGAVRPLTRPPRGHPQGIATASPASLRGLTPRRTRRARRPRQQQATGEGHDHPPFSRFSPASTEQQDHDHDQWSSVVRHRLMVPVDTATADATRSLGVLLAEPDRPDEAESRVPQGRRRQPHRRRNGLGGAQASC
jgi:hypothetical protein